MAQKHLYRDIDGTLVDMSAYAPRLNWIAQSKAEEGTYGSWTVTLDDPNGELDILGHRQWFVEDDESEDEDDIIWGGFTGAQTFARMEGDQRRKYGPEARVITVELMDANSWFAKIIMLGADANRTSVETDAERMEWLLGTSEASLIDDTTTFVGVASPRNMDAADLRGTYVGQIIADCAGTSGKNHFLWYRKVAGVRTLTIWYGRDSSSLYPSPYYLTNDLAALRGEDVDPVVLPYVAELSADAKMRRSPEKQYCRCYATYGDKGAAVMRHNATTHALIASYGSGHRDMTSHFPLVKTKTSAQNRADRQLLDVQDQEIRVTTTARNIPSTRVTLLKAGMRVELQGTHWGPDLTDWHYGRIVSAQPKPHSKGDLYDIDLEIATGAGSDGPPAPPVPPEATSGGILYQPGDGTNDVDTEFLIYWGSTGDNPGTGYGARPRDADHFDYIAAVPVVEGWEVLATSGTLDLAIQFGMTDVAAVRTYVAQLRHNGVVIATDTYHKTGGLSAVVRTFNINVSNLAVVAGDLLTVWITANQPMNPVVPTGTGSLSDKFEILNTSTVVP